MTNEEAIEIITLMYDMANNSVSTNTSNAEALDMALRALKNEQTDGDLISREIEKADFLMAKVKDFERTAIRVKHNTEIIDRLIDYIHGVIVNAEKDNFVIGEERKYALREKFKLPSAEKTAEWISVLEQIKEELSHISKPEIDKEDYENGVYDGVNLAIRTIDKYAGELVHTDISLIKKDILSELEKLENYPSKDNSVFARINTYKRCIGIIDKHIGELEQTAEWEYSYFLDKWRCTKCFQSNNEKTKYCPNCGAKMKEGDTE